MPLTPLLRASALSAGLGAHLGLAAAAGVALAVLAAPTPASASCSLNNAPAVNFGTISVVADAQRTATTPITVRCTSSTNPLTQRFACFRFPAANFGDTASARVMRSGLNAGPSFTIAASATAPPLGTGSTDYEAVALGALFGATATLTPTFTLAGGQAAGEGLGTYTTSQPVVVDVYFSLFGQNCTFNLESSDRFTFPVSVTVAAGCNFGTIDRMDFGQAGALNQALDAQAGVRVTCTAGTPWTLSFGGGQNLSGSDRRMKSGTNYITYRLFKDAGRAQALAVNGTTTGSGTGAAQTTTIYGRVDPAPIPRVGSYSDFVVVTLSF